MDLITERKDCIVDNRDLNNRVVILFGDDVPFVKVFRKHRLLADEILIEKAIQSRQKKGRRRLSSNLSDFTRCNDFNCPINAFCLRFKQRLIDSQTGRKRNVFDFQGCKKNGLWDYFINAFED